MKKLSFLLFAFFAGVLLLSSCSKDNETFSPPTLNFIGGAGYIDQNETIPANTFFIVGIAASANTQSGEKLATLRLTRTMDNSTFVDTTFTINDNQFNADFTFNAQAAGKVEKITFLLTDKNAQSTSMSLTLTYAAVGVAVTKNMDVLMGSFNDDYGSFYSTVNKIAYNIADAGTHQADIDFLYYFGAVNGSSIASPADAKANEVYAMGSWTVKNETVFSNTTLTATDFDAIGDTYLFPAFTGTASSITHLAVGNVIMFKTVGQKLGLIKINQITSRGDYASIDVIVEQ